jgi:hypothetical protein
MSSDRIVYLPSARPPAHFPTRILIQQFGVDRWGRLGWCGKPDATMPDMQKAESELQRANNISPSGKFRIAVVYGQESGEFSPQ